MVILSSIMASATRVPRAITNMIQAGDNAARMATLSSIMVCATNVHQDITRSGRVRDIAARRDTRIILTGNAGNVSREVSMIPDPVCAALAITRIITMASATSASRDIQNTAPVAVSVAGTVTRIILMHSAGSARRAVHMTRHPVHAVREITRFTIMASASRVNRDIQNMIPVAASAARTATRIILMRNAGSARRAVHMTRHPVHAVRGITRFTTKGNAMNAKKDFSNTMPVKATAVRKAIPIFPEIHVTQQRVLTIPGQNPQLLLLVPEQQYLPALPDRSRKSQPRHRQQHLP
jgi:hypothetical protein